MKRSKKTKIVATLGPAIGDKEILLKMFKEGVNVIRVNFSHADHDDVRKKITMIREINQESGFNVAVLADLQGPKLRVGVVKEGIVLKEDEILTFTNEEIIGDEKRVYMSYTRFAQDVKVNERILIDDGKLILEVVETDDKSEVKAKVLQGGPLSSKKGVNLPNTNVSLPALTEKDIKDVLFALTCDVDWFALSFVRSYEDVRDLRDLIDKNSDHRTPIIAKIEKPEGVKNIDDILKISDGLMVARGDLGIEIPMELVPLEQKKLVMKAKMASKPVIIATQMMESMISGLTPTRAEVNDVANSVMDGADAVMLSGETSIGKHPVEVIKVMTKIIHQVEDDIDIKVPIHLPVKNDNRYITDSICFSAASMVDRIGAKAVVTITNSGYTAFQISSYRPLSHIIVFTSSRRVVSMLSLLWGVNAYYYDAENKSTDDTVVEVNNLVAKLGYAKSGDFLININAMPYFLQGRTNTIRLTRL